MDSHMSFIASLINRYHRVATLPVAAQRSVPEETHAILLPLAYGEQPSAAFTQVSAAQLHALGFSGALGEVVALPGTPTVFLAGTGAADAPGTGGRSAQLRDAVGAASLRAAAHSQVAVVLGDDDPESIQAAVEGTILARYRFDPLSQKSVSSPLSGLTVVTPDADANATQISVIRGRAAAAATSLARDLANAPHNYLTASTLGELAAQLGAEVGLEVEIWDENRVRSEALGGLLAINAGSAEPPRMIKLTYEPLSAPAGHLALVGKGIMYDSGGIGLKPNNASHAQMKSDMTGAADILAAMLALPSSGATATVTGYLMCTDNMPSATATALGDVISIRGGRTVEIVDTDAEGRVVLADGIVLAAEQQPDAIIDIATLTGSVARALGPKVAGVFSTEPRLVTELREAGRCTGEPVWELPLAFEYRSEIDSPVADLRNVGPDGAPDGLIAPLFMHEFTGGIPWGHIDIAGTAWNGSAAGWRSEGCSGFGARLLLAFARDFSR